MNHLSVRADRRLIRPASRSHRFVLAAVTAPVAIREGARSPVNLAFVLDRSGSMSGPKIRLARLAVEEAIQRLLPTDRFSVVVYDEAIDVVVPNTTASAEAKRSAVERLASIDARGSTNLGDGWLRGCEQIALHETDGVRRVLLLTDGLANVGMTDPGQLAAHASELRARGIATSTFGVGDDFDEALLQQMADAGGGHFYYISDAAQIRDHITSEVGETLEVVAHEVVLEVTAPESFRVEPVSPHVARTRGARTSISLGDLVSDQRVSVVLRLEFPYGEIGRETGILVSLADRDGALARGGDAPVPVTWLYADDRENDVQPRDRIVDLAVAHQYAARARQEAVRLNRAGDFTGARNAVVGVARRVRKYAGSDTRLRKVADELEVHAAELAAPMVERNLKAMHFSSANVARSRDALGRSLRESR
jgi:Ca-activated chloride channel homolog